MIEGQSKPITQMLAEMKNGDSAALNELLPIVYSELRRLADCYLRRERDDHTLQPTALVHEAYLRLVGQKEIDWQNRAHFFGIAARLMRQILIESARSRGREKRGGEQFRHRVSLDDAISFYEEQDVNLIALDAALTKLENLDSAQSRIVELRFFGGLSVEEAAEVLQISASTVKREWQTAKLWLLREISSS